MGGWVDGETSWKYLQTHSGRDFLIIEAEAISEMHKTGETPPPAASRKEAK